MESIGQKGLEAHALPAQERCTGACQADRDAHASTSHAAQPEDRYIPAAGQERYGIYTRDSLLGHGTLPGEPVPSLDDEGMDARSVSFGDGEKRQANGAPELDEGDKELIKRLQARDREVHQHEAAHAAAAGEYAAGAPTYSYQRGPDGKMYAIGGSVALDVGKEATPEENRLKSMKLRGAAMGVSEASAADAMVAAQAGQLMPGFQAEA